MKTAVINIKIDPGTKKKAQKIAHELGFSLSTVLNGYIRNFVRTKKIKFELEEKPSPYMVQALKESEEDRKAGRISPHFSNVQDAIAWLDKTV